MPLPLALPLLIAARNWSIDSGDHAGHWLGGFNKGGFGKGPNKGKGVGQQIFTHGYTSGQKCQRINFLTGEIEEAYEDNTVQEADKCLGSISLQQVSMPEIDDEEELTRLTRIELKELTARLYEDRKTYNYKIGDTESEALDDNDNYFNIDDDQGCLGELSTVAVDWEKDYIKVEIVVDSGACDHVGPESILPDVPIKETIASKQGLYYLAAKGSKRHNLGITEFNAYSDLVDTLGMRMQVGQGTKKFLGSQQCWMPCGTRQ